MTAKRGEDLYRAAGVDPDRKDAFLRALRRHGLSAEGWGDRLDLGEIPEEADLVAAADGVGTKTILLARAGHYRTAGWDAAAMVVNDLLARGARPRFLLDVFLADRLREAETEVLEGFFDAARETGAKVLAGETAELPGLLAEGSFEILAIGLGLLPRRKARVPRGGRAGDVLLGLASSGPHASGFSLVRRALEKFPQGLAEDWDGTSAEECLLAPTRIYLSLVGDVLHYCEVHSLAHITGGGLLGRVGKMVSPGCEAVLRFASWPPPEWVLGLSKWTGIEPIDLGDVMNLGIGFVIALDPFEAEAAEEFFTRRGETCFRIGHIQPSVSPQEGGTARWA